ncbi:hypothetical protein [Streptomyces sp. CAU 1734]|uniref:hypothetical protein n=1 Tax=Streptomyces sp. CAU 1734 TaxID=3140360 RepID=UPI003260B44F
MASKCLRELIAEADERGLAASGLACLERCLPQPESDADVLRPLWAGLAGGAARWPASLAGALAAGEARAEDPEAGDESAVLVRELLRAAPADWEAGALREWAEACSVAALELHHGLDAGSASGSASSAGGDQGTGGEPPAAAEVIEILKGYRQGAPSTAGPLVTGELRRQIRVLEILAEGEGGAGLRQVLRVSTEGRRVLRAVVSRRARVRR